MVFNELVKEMKFKSNYAFNKVKTKLRGEKNRINRYYSKLSYKPSSSG